MIYELRTYTLKTGALETVNKMFAERLEHRVKYSPLAGYWYTDIGPLNQIIHIWPYKDLAERAKIRESFAKDPNWPPPILEHIVTMESDVIVPFHTHDELKPAKLGPIYEMRYYNLVPGTVPKVKEMWTAMLPERVKMTPCLLAGVTEFGELNKLIHIWPYASLEQRSAMRKKAVDTGVWPPKTGPMFQVMHNKVMLPAPFSPLQ